LATKLHYAEILLTDWIMLDAMIETMPDGAELRGRLRRGYRGVVHRYYADTRTAFTISADGTIAQCFEVCEVTPQEALQIAEACDEIEEWSVRAFQATIGQILGRDIQRVL
jgi:hypothetical protein